MPPISPSRRKFLQTLGASALAAPFLPLLNASGQEALMPRRLLLFFTPHGAGLWNQWIPTNTNDLKTSPILAPLARHQAKVNVVHGLKEYPLNAALSHLEGHSYRFPILWSGTENNVANTFNDGGITVDQSIAQAIGQQTAFASIELGANSNPGLANGSTRMIWNQQNQPISPECDPVAALARLFGSPAAAQAGQQITSLNVAQAELARLRPRLASADRFKLDAHAASISDLSRRLTAKNAACARPALIASNPYALVGEAATDLDLLRMMDLVTGAFACDLTRVASIQYLIADNDYQQYTALVGAGLDSHHATTHDDTTIPANITMLTQIHNLFAEHFARLLDRLDAIPEGSGTMLDNTMVVWGSEYGEGHNVDPIPFVIAGSGGGAYKTGRYIDLVPFVEHNRLLVSMANVMGLNVKTFGNTDQGSGPLAQL